MNHIFKQSISIDGQTFPISQNGAPRVHAVPPKIEKHPHFKFYQKAGLIVSHAAPIPDEKPETPAERAKRIHTSSGKRLEPNSTSENGEDDDDKTFDDEIADSDETEGEDLEDESGDDVSAEGSEADSEGDESESVEDDFDVEEDDAEVEPKKKAMRPKAKKKKAKSRK